MPISLFQKLLHKLPKWADAPLLLIGALVLRLVNLGGQHLWYDEAFTAWVAKPSTDLWAAILGDNHPPLWSVIQAINVKLFGLSEFSFRLPSALLGAGAVGLLWLIAKRLKFSRQAALTVGILAIIAPGLIGQAQDARMYDLLLVGVLAAVYGALRKNWYLFTVGATVAMYTQNTGTLYIALIGLLSFGSAFIRRDKRELGKILMSGAVIMLVYLPWIPSLIQQVQSVGTAYWTAPFSVAQLPGFLYDNLIGFRLPSALLAVSYGTVQTFSLVALWRSRKWLTTSPVMLVALFGVPIILALVSVLWRNLYIARALLPSSALMLLVWGQAFYGFQPRLQKIAASAVVPFLVAGLVGQYFPPEHKGHTDLTAWLAPMREQWREGDVIYHPARATVIGYGLYAEGLPYRVRPLTGDLIQVTDAAAHAFGIDQYETTFDDLHAYGFQRAWVIVNWSPLTRQDTRDEMQTILQYPATLIRRTTTNPYMTDELWLVETTPRRDVQRVDSILIFNGGNEY